MGTTGHDFVLEVIEKYKSHECLWKLSNEHYHDKARRNAALDDILRLFHTKDPKANRETVQKKLQSMRSSYNKELRKVKVSQSSGCDPDSVHVPKLWYYNSLSFLQDQEIPRKSRTIIDDLPFGEDETIDSMDDNTQSPGPSNFSFSTPPLSFKRPAPKVDIVLEKIAKRMDAPAPVEKPKQQHDAFGEYVSEKLRSIPSSMVPYCQKLINDAIFYAEIESLDISSRIVTSEEPTSRIKTEMNTYYSHVNNEDQSYQDLA